MELLHHSSIGMLFLGECTCPRSVAEKSKIRGRHGGVEKRGGWKTARMTPLPKRGFGPPFVRYVFHLPQGSVLFFAVQKSTTEPTRSFLGGAQFSGEGVLWYVFLPPYVLHPPPISRPNKSRLHLLPRVGDARELPGLGTELLCRWLRHVEQGINSSCWSVI